MAADRKGIKGWLRNIFSEAEKESEVLGEAGFSELADELASVLQSLAVQPWLPEHIINIEIPSHQPDKECPSILTGAVVRSSSTAALILQLAQRPEIEWESIDWCRKSCHFSGHPTTIEDIDQSLLVLIAPAKERYAFN